MTATRTAIYRANVQSPQGHFTFAVDSTETDARLDIITAAQAEFRCHVGMLRVDEPVKSNRRLIASMWPVRKCQLSGNRWAWYIR